MSINGFFAKRSLRVPDTQRTRATELTLKESIFPIALVTVLFFLWGFSYGLLDTLNKHFQDTLDITKARSAGLQAAYFGAYPLASLGHADWVLHRFGYRAAFIWGLVLFALGAIFCIPSIIAKSFAGFCISIFVIGNGLGALETAANPYIAVCGPQEHAEFRVNLAQAFNGVGTVIAPVLGSYVFFAFDDYRALQNVQWVYLSIAVVVLALACIFFLAQIPEVTDADLAYRAAEIYGEDGRPWYKHWNAFHAAFTQFCYTGSQVAIASYFINYVTETRSNTDAALASKFLAGAQAVFAVGRFLGTGTMYFIRPRLVLLIFLTMCIIFTIPAILKRENAGMAMLFVVFFFESICFPTIVALGLRGAGRHTKRLSGFIIGAVMGGACVPPLTGIAADLHGTATAMVVPLTFLIVAWAYPISVNFVPAYRATVDGRNLAEVGIQGHCRAVVDEELGKSEQRKKIVSEKA